MRDPAQWQVCLTHRTEERCCKVNGSCSTLHTENTGDFKVLTLPDMHFIQDHFTQACFSDGPRLKHNVCLWAGNVNGCMSDYISLHPSLFMSSEKKACVLFHFCRYKKKGVLSVKIGSVYVRFMQEFFFFFWFILLSIYDYFLQRLRIRTCVKQMYTDANWNKDGCIHWCKRTSLSVFMI